MPYATRRGLLMTTGLTIATTGAAEPWIVPQAGDATEDFVRAMQSANSARGDASVGAAIFLPKGTYHIHELPWDGLTSFVGEEVGSTILKYNGKGGHGSHLIGLNKTDGAVPFAGFYNMTIDGFNGTPGATAVAEHGCFLRSDIDWGWKHENVQYVNCFGDAIRIEGEVVNLHIDRIRWDNIGGWGIAIAGKITQENRPLSLSRFSYDNAIHPGPFQDAVRRMGLFDGKRWGHGVLKIEPHADGVSASLTDGRVELNHPCRAEAGLPSWVMMRHSGKGAAASILLRNVKGFFHPDTPGVVVFAPTGGVSSVGQNVGAGAAIANYFDRHHPERTTSSFAQHFVALANPQQDQGIAINGSMIEFRNECPDGNVVDGLYEGGSIVFNLSAGVGDNLGWTRSGHAVQTTGARTLSKSATVKQGSAVLGVPARDLTNFRPGRGVVLAGAGLEGAGLAAVVRDIDADRQEVVLNVAVAKGLKACTVYEAMPAWQPFGIVGARSLAPQTVSSATTVAELLADFNALLRKLQDAKLMGT